jgi:hypothetical protein
MAIAVSVQLRARDMRFLKAANEVLKRYRLKRRETLGADGCCCIEITGGSADYLVAVHPDWAARPTCTCPDASRLARVHNGGYCKHIIGVLLGEKDFQYQLLELLL